MDVASWLVNSISVQSAAGTVSSSGERVYGTARTIAARVERISKTIQNAQGQEVAVDTAVLTAEEIKHDDLVKLTGDSSPRTPALIKSASVKDGSVSLWEAWL